MQSHTYIPQLDAAVFTGFHTVFGWKCAVTLYLIVHCIYFTLLLIASERCSSANLSTYLLLSKCM